jgi:SMC interacting uncharacterized protein involved in chromosome segregation
MTEGETTILREIGSLRLHLDTSLSKVHDRIQATDKEVEKVKQTAMVNKTKIGTFVAGMVFVFTGLGTLIQYYIGSHFK